MIVEATLEEIGSTEATFVLPGVGKTQRRPPPSILALERRKILDELSEYDRLVIWPGIRGDAPEWFAGVAVRRRIERLPSLCKKAYRTIGGGRAEQLIEGANRPSLGAVTAGQFL